MNILFVCSQGKIRSRTACITLKAAWNEVRYCGTDNDAEVPIRREDVDWAHVIVCMEKEHQEALLTRWPQHSSDILVWNIPDKYYLLEDELCHILRRKCMDCLEG